jgi:hypothetical protein
MNQSEALSQAVEMLERVAPGRNYDRREFYERLSEIKATVSQMGSGPAKQRPSEMVADTSPSFSLVQWPRTTIEDGEEFFEIDRQTIDGRELILMESCRDGSEAPAIMVDASTNETVLDEVYNGFDDYRRAS